MYSLDVVSNQTHLDDKEIEKQKSIKIARDTIIIFLVDE